jgi:hypothetical protein
MLLGNLLLVASLISYCVTNFTSSAAIRSEVDIRFIKFMASFTVSIIVATALVGFIMTDPTFFLTVGFGKSIIFCFLVSALPMCLVGNSLGVVYSSTFGTYSRPTFCNINIIFREFVSSIAACFSRVYSRWSNAPKCIDFTSNGLKMIRIYAKSISTKMIKIHSFRYWALDKFICNSMGALVFSIYNYASVIIISSPLGTNPQPARCSFFNLIPKSILNINPWPCHMTVYNECFNRSKQNIAIKNMLALFFYLLGQRRCEWRVIPLLIECA